MGRLIALIFILTLAGCSHLPLFNEVSFNADEKRPVVVTKVVEMQPPYIRWMIYFNSLTVANQKKIDSEIKLNKSQAKKLVTTDATWKYIMSLLASNRRSHHRTANRLLRNEKVNLSKDLDPSYIEFHKFVLFQSRRVASKNSKLVNQRKEIDKQEKYAQVLQKQIDALKAIEKNIAERELGITANGR